MYLDIIGKWRNVSELTAGLGKMEMKIFLPVSITAMQRTASTGGR